MLEPGSPTKRHKVHLVNLGCPKNLVDSEQMSGLLQGNGYELTDDAREADVQSALADICALEVNRAEPFLLRIEEVG